MRIAGFQKIWGGVPSTLLLENVCGLDILREVEYVSFFARSQVLITNKLLSKHFSLVLSGDISPAKSVRRTHNKLFFHCAVFSRRTTRKEGHTPLTVAGPIANHLAFFPLLVISVGVCCVCLSAVGITWLAVYQTNFHP